jgi:hypothetical protein
MGRFFYCALPLALPFLHRKMFLDFQRVRMPCFPIMSSFATPPSSLQTGLAGVRHIGTDKDFSPVIQRALEMEGFNEDNMPDAEEVAEERAEEGRLSEVTVGFGHHAVLSVAGQVIDAVKTGKLEHIFLIGGYEGRGGRDLGKHICLIGG